MNTLAEKDRPAFKTGSMILVLMVVFLVFAFISQSSAKAIRKPSISLALSAKLQEALNKSSTGVVGVSAAILIAKQGMWTGVKGYSNPNAAPPVPVTPNMLFQIGSVTKNFTAALILKLAEEGKVNLDDPVVKYLREFQGAPQLPQTVTIRMALNMTSGTFNLTNNPAYWMDLQSNFGRFFDPQATVKAYVQAPSFEPGTNWEYSNTNYLLAGMIIQALTRNYNVVPAFRSYFFNRYKLGRTFLGGYEELTGAVADMWIDYNGDGILDNLAAVPHRGALTSSWTAGGFLSTASNLAIWIDALYGKQTVLSQSSLKEMLTFIDTTGKPSAAGQLYDGFGLGTMRIRYDLKLGDRTEKVELIGYYGDTQGEGAFAFYLKNKNTTIAFTINQQAAYQQRASIMAALVTVLMQELP